jgi:large subunit ribosomal protein L7/L12
MATADERISAAISAAEQRAKDAAKQLQQLKAKRELIEAQKLTKMLKGERSDDTRRKILAGALTLELMERDEATRQRFMDRLDKYLTRKDDRALFGLPPVPAAPSPEPTTTSGATA